MSKPHIILVEQDIFLQDMYTKMLTTEFDVSAVCDAQSCIDIIDSKAVNLIISDIQLGFNNGIEILHELRSYEDWLDMPLIVLSSLPQTSFPTSFNWSNYGVIEFLYKPKLSPNILLTSARKACNVEPIANIKFTDAI